MNINLIKEEIEKNLNARCVVSVHGMRSRVTRYEGKIYKIYPNIFTIKTNNEEKSFSYHDVITGDVKIKYF